LKKDIDNNFIRFGSTILSDFCVVDIIGDTDKVNEFLQGQLTSDINLLNETKSQLSSICDHKGYVVADLIVSKLNNQIKIIINKNIKKIFINELKPYAKFFNIQFKNTNDVVIGNLNKKNGRSSLCSYKQIDIDISIQNKDFFIIDNITQYEWSAVNKLAGNLFLKKDEVRKYRPIEINYDNLRVSFDKGCYRGQEIVARMHYLGLNRRKFCTFISDVEFEEIQEIKIVGDIIEIDNKKIFNGIIKKDLEQEVADNSLIIKII